MPKVRRSRLKVGPVTPPSAVLRELEENMIRLHELRRQASDIQEQIDGTPTTTGVQAKVVAGLKAIGKDKYSFDGPSGTKYNATKGQSMTRWVNEDKLKRKVGPSVWRKITSLVMDKKKAEAAIADGLIDPVDYADCIEEKPGAEYAKVTTK